MWCCFGRPELELKDQSTIDLIKRQLALQIGPSSSRGPSESRGLTF
jgi:hypothetical protein